MVGEIESTEDRSEDKCAVTVSSSHEDLRAENERLRADLAAQRRECDILRGSKHGRTASQPRAVSLSDTQRARLDELEAYVDLMRSALGEISQRDCSYYGEDLKDGEPCPCHACVARKALDDVATFRWGGHRVMPIHRFVGALPERLEIPYANAREVKIHRAWVKYMELHGADRTLEMILHDARCPSARDWYVATSVVQWLATNCGSSILEAADFCYTKYDEDSRAYWSHVHQLDNVASK